jgi:glycosyltransferase involved in cell wall biosynthesis
VRIAFVVERPTQFEAPFFRHAARDPRHELRVLYTGSAPAAPVFDPELGRAVAWGIDLVGGYPHAVAPAAGRARWLAGELRRGGFDLAIVNGYTRPLYLLAALLARRAGIATALRIDSVRWESAATTRRLAEHVPERRAQAAANGERGSRDKRLRRVAAGAVLPRLFDLFLGVGSLTLDYLAALGVPPERRGLFPYAVDVDDFRARSRLGAVEREAVRARLGLPPQPATPETSAAAVAKAPAAPPAATAATAAPTADSADSATATAAAMAPAPAGAPGGAPPPPAPPAILAVAKLNDREAPWDLLRALPHLPPRAHLLLAGDGPARAEMERLAAALGAGRVHFLGYVAYGELPALYAAADLFVHAAAEERWGVSVAEALACGLPVVASSRVGAAYDLLAAGANGWIYEAGDAAGLGRRATQALALDRRAVAAANREVLARWDYDASWRHILDAAGRIVRGSAP